MFVTKVISSLIEKVELRADPIVIKVNEFNESASAAFSMQFALAHETGQSIIPIVIDSYGGEVYSLMSMVSLVKASRLKVATIIMGKAMSSGAIFASCGHEGYRFAAPNATLMIHDVSASAFGKNEELKSKASEVDRLNNYVYTLLAQNCGKSDDYFRKLNHDHGHSDWLLTAEDMLEHNIINHIRIPQMTTTVSVDINFT